MSCGCKTSGNSTHSCGSKSSTGCASVDTCGNSYKLSVFDWLATIEQPSSTKKESIVEVRFKNERKAFFKNTNNLPLHIGSIVIVETNPGHDVGVVSLTGELVKIQMKKKGFSEENATQIYRIATQKDIDTWNSVREKEETIKREARRLASFHRLNMKITDVEYQGDGSKITFYYIADSRVDFRQLIKDYALSFKSKIDMKQIGFRQEAAKVGGLGSCGRELCCSTWLTDFRSVNTNAARYQQLSINPQKLAGQCGKLKCCLNFELDSYVDALSHFPPTNSVLDTEKGRAFCIKIDVFKKKMWFAYVENSITWYDVDIEKVTKELANNRKGIKSPTLEELSGAEVTNAGFKPSADLIQENKVDRFEKKKKGNRNHKRHQNPQNSSQEKRAEKIKPQEERLPKKENKKQNNNRQNHSPQERKNREFKPQNRNRPSNQDKKQHHNENQSPKKVQKPSQDTK